MLKQRENDIAERRYRKTLEGYLAAQLCFPEMTLRSYCSMNRIYHRGLVKWMRKEGISHPGKKKWRHNSGNVAFPPSISEYDNGEVFVQIYPDSILRGVARDKGEV